MEETALECFNSRVTHNYRLWVSVQVRLHMRKKLFWSFFSLKKRKFKRWGMHVPWLSQGWLRSVFFRNSYIFSLHLDACLQDYASSSVLTFTNTICVSLSVPTLYVFHCLLVTNCAVLRWTVSSCSITPLL